MIDSRPPKRRWYRLTPDRLLLALLPIVGLLWLSERFRWFAFNEHKNWTVLIAVAVVCVAVALLLLWLAVSLVSRCRFQFGIRSLLVLVMVVAVMCSWFTVKMQQARRQREAIEATEKTIEYDALYDYQFDADGKYQPKPKPPGPPWLRNLLGVDFLSDVEYLIYKQATDADLERLKELTRLEFLWLDGTQVTDAGLVHLKGLTSLQLLGLLDTQVTDAGVEDLQKALPNCTIKPQSTVKVVVLLGTQVTDAGVEDLQKALPNCKMP